jgi:hypothetical protein
MTAKTKRFFMGPLVAAHKLNRNRSDGGVAQYPEVFLWRFSSIDDCCLSSGCVLRTFQRK